MSEPGLYRLGHVVVDARRLTATDFKTPDAVSVVSSVPPLAVSPDERRFAWFAYAGGSDETPALVVTNWQTSQSELLPMDPDRMRFPEPDVLDPAWVAHHFEWVPADDGQLHLRERASFVPLPFRGTVTLGAAGAYQGYSLTPGSEELRTALVSVLVDGMKGERLPDELNGYQQRVRVRNTELSVTVGESPSYVSVYTLAGPPGGNDGGRRRTGRGAGDRTVRRDDRGRAQGPPATDRRTAVGTPFHTRTWGRVY